MHGAYVHEDSLEVASREAIMAEMTMPSWDESNMHHIFDGVLIRSMVEFRSALQVLRRYEAARGSEYVEHMREGLHAVEAELTRRGIEVDGQSSNGEALLERFARAGVPQRSRPKERLPVPPPRTWPSRKKV